MDGTTANDGNVQQATLMGVLRCLFERHERGKLSGFKKRFWVIVRDNHGGHLEMYKNDQAHVPHTIVKAKDIREVIYAGDKQNRFYVLLVQTRRHYDIRFRMNSSEERDRWAAAISRIMEEYSMQDRKASIIELTRRRATDVGKRLGVTITTDTEKLYSTSMDLAPYITEAVDLALNNVTEIMSYQHDLAVPRIYTLTLQARECRDLRYDPVKRSIVMNVCLYRDYIGKATITVTAAEQVLQILQSDVYRDPVIEGWTSNPRCEEVARYLGKRGKVVTLEWNRHVNDRVKVEAYLERFVTDEFLKGILDTLKVTVAQLAIMIEAQQKQFPSVLLSENATPRNTGSYHYSRVASSIGLAAGTHRGTLSTHHSTSSSTATHESDGTPSEAIALSLLSDNISGLAIQLSNDAVERCARAPDVKVSHTDEYEQCRPAFSLAARFHAVLPPTTVRRESVLQEQLYDVAFTALLMRVAVSLRTHVNAVFEKRVKVVVMWDNLSRVLKRMGRQLQRVELLQLVSCLEDIYVPRLQFVAQTLGRTPGTTTLQEDGDTTLYDTFCECVGAVVVDFSYLESDTKKPPSPSVNDGKLHDYLLLAPRHEAALLLAAVNTARGATARYAPTIVSGVCVCAALPRLAAWCEQYFSKPEHRIPCTERQVLDEFDDGIDLSVCRPFSLDVDDDAVANERSAEIRVLNMQRAVNMIYDSQGSAVELKVRVEDITTAVNSLEKAFGGNHVNKHDLVRVFVSNLHRLRNMYIRAAETNEYLLEPEALQLLRDFCEYEESECSIEQILAAGRNSSPNFASPMFSSGVLQPLHRDESGNAEIQARYRFQPIARAALNELLPLEAVFARKAWRTGLLFGLENTGKTLITNSIRGIARPTTATVGLSQKVLPFNEWVFAVNELGGRASFRKNWRYYISRMGEVSFLIFVVDTQNRGLFQDARDFLCAVARHLGSVPLVVIFNNFREPRYHANPDADRTALARLEQAVGIPERRRENPTRELIVCKCDISVVHASNKELPAEVKAALVQLSQVLKRISPPDCIPLVPKSMSEDSTEAPSLDDMEAS